MIVAHIVDALADNRYLDDDTGRFCLEKSGLMCYSHGGYYSLGEILGTFGFSVKKNKIKR